MIWEPFALAVAFGLLTSATIYFIFVWPRREPDDAPEAASDDAPAATAKATIQATSDDPSTPGARAR